MTSAAAIAGIQRYGLGWRKTIHLSHLTKLIGEQSDADEPDMVIVVKAAKAISRKVRIFIERHYPDNECADRVVEILDEINELDPEDDIETVHYYLDDVWNFFDFERVVVQ